MAKSLAKIGLLICVVAAMVLPSGGAGASIAHGTVVSDNPANFTPNVESDAAVSQTGRARPEAAGRNDVRGRQVPVGLGLVAYDHLRPPQPHVLQRHDRSSHLIRPRVQRNGLGDRGQLGPRSTSAATSRPSTGSTAKKLVKLDASSGEVDQTFKPMIKSGDVTEIRLVDGRLIIGRQVPGQLAALDPATGADTGYIDLPITGRVADNSGPTKVYKFAVNPAGTRSGGARQLHVGGRCSKRWQAFMLDLGPRG